MQFWKFSKRVILTYALLAVVLPRLALARESSVRINESNDYSSFRRAEENWVRHLMTERSMIPVRTGNPLLYNVNENWDRDLVRAKFFIDYRSLFAPTRSAAPVAINPNALTETSIMSMFDRTYSSAYTLKQAFVSNYRPVLREYIYRLIVNQSVWFPIRDLGRGMMDIRLPSGRSDRPFRRVQFAANSSVMDIPEVAAFINCYISNGQPVSARLATCGPGVIARENINSVTVSVDTLARKISEIGYCFGLDPLVYAGMLFRETGFQGSGITSAGTGFTQMTAIGILEVEQQMNRDIFLNSSMAASVSNIDEDDRRATMTNVLCYSPNWRNHSVTSIAATDRETLRHPFESMRRTASTELIRTVKNWMVNDSTASAETLLDRQFVYGAVLKKGYVTRFLHNTRQVERTMYDHYYQVGYNYNDNPEVRVSYANDLVRDFPGFIGLAVPRDDYYDCRVLFPQVGTFVVRPSDLTSRLERCRESLRTTL